MTKLVWEQTADDMDSRFSSGGFAAAGGNIQSLTFAYAGLMRLLDGSPLSKMLVPLAGWKSTPAKDGSKLVDGMRATIYDMGCAEGDGTAVLSSAFPFSTITGIDISPEAIYRAKIRWPHLNFRVGDITAPDFNAASIIFTSHTIEHMEYPAAVIKGLRCRCSLLIVIVPPTGENQHGLTHHGAKPVAKWLPTLPEPLYQANYNTLRPDPESNSIIEEGNILLVWKGEI